MPGKKMMKAKKKTVVVLPKKMMGVYKKAHKGKKSKKN